MQHNGIHFTEDNAWVYLRTYSMYSIMLFINTSRLWLLCIHTYSYIITIVSTYMFPVYKNSF